MGNGLEAEPGYHRDDEGLDQKQFGVEGHRMRLHRVPGQRGDGRHGRDQQAGYADFRPDRGPRNDARAKAEDEAHGDEVEQGIMGGYGHQIEER